MQHSNNLAYNPPSSSPPAGHTNPPPKFVDLTGDGDAIGGLAQLPRTASSVHSAVVVSRGGPPAAAAGPDTHQPPPATGGHPGPDLFGGAPPPQPKFIDLTGDGDMAVLGSLMEPTQAPINVSGMAYQLPSSLQPRET